MADITRDDLATIIQEEYSSALLGTAVEGSAVLQAFRRVDMGTKVQNLPVLATIPEAEWVGESATESTGVKPTAKATWGNKQLHAEEVAVIIPVHENTVDDATTQVLDEITKQGGAALGRKLDASVLFGTDKPASWTSPDLYTAAVNAGTVEEVSATPGVQDLVGSFFQAAEDVEEQGWEPSDVITARGMRFRFANARSSTGEPIWLPSLSQAPGSVDTLAGLNMRYVSGLVWDRDIASGFVVDASRVIIGVRQDVTVKFLDQATVGGINLAERDMVALRFKARFAYVLGDTRTGEGDSPRTPVALVAPTGWPS